MVTVIDEPTSGSFKTRMSALGFDFHYGEEVLVFAIDWAVTSRQSTCSSDSSPVPKISSSQYQAHPHNGDNYHPAKKTLFHLFPVPQGCKT